MDTKQAGINWKIIVRSLAHPDMKKRVLAVLGIDATLRMVDPVQFRKRVDEFDYDITTERFNFSTTPGDSLRSYFSSQSAKINGSFNLAGISDPVVDALIVKR